jgi:DNA-binding transcriptional LysR family regulator
VFIRQLRYLVALARECHFARAAPACHVSQPALSAGLHKLECELGVRIIERTPQFRGFTPEGKRVLIWAQRILADWQALVQDVSEESPEGLQGTVRLGVVPAALPGVGVLVEEFCARYPATRVLTQQMCRLQSAPWRDPGYHLGNRSRGSRSGKRIPVPMA